MNDFPALCLERAHQKGEVQGPGWGGELLGKGFKGKVRDTEIHFNCNLKLPS